MARRELSAAFVRTAGPGRHCDGDGLYLLVKKTGAVSGSFDTGSPEPKCGKPGLAALVSPKIA